VLTSFYASLEIQFHSPLHIGTGEGVIGIIDRQTLSHRDRNVRMPIILGHTVKGVARDHFRKISRLTETEREIEECLFGTETKQGMVYFSPWRIEQNLRESMEPFASLLFDTKTGNQIVRSRRVAKHDHLFTYEIVKEQLLWTGNVSGQVHDEPLLHGVPKPLLLLLLALKSIKCIGGRRRSGSGACTVIIKQLTVHDRTYSETEVDKLLTRSVANLVGGK
jgi:CRISPR/Cas system CSM-associated protein Csm3 (group 7 of RAMP superfamily)